MRFCIAIMVHEAPAGRCKQWMNSVDYNMTTLIYPREVGLRMLPFGLPQGWNLEHFGTVFHKSFSVIGFFSLDAVRFPPPLSPAVLPPFFNSSAGLGEKREITDDQVQHIQKFLPVLRYPLYNLERCADFLESWISGSLPAQPLLDVSALLDLCL